MRVAFVLARLPWPVVEGSAVQITNVMRAMAQKHDVRVLALVASHEEAQRGAALARYLGGTTRVEAVPRESHRSFAHRVAYRLLREAGDRLLATPGEVLFNRSPELDRRIAELVRAGEVDCLACEYWFMMPHILGHGLPAILDEDDVNFQRLARGAETLPAGPARRRLEAQARKVERYELRMVNAASHVITVSQADRDTLQTHGGQPPMTAVPIGVGPQVRVLPPPPDDALPVLVFVGSFRHAPNTDGILWFGRDVYPLIRRQVPNARLIVAGREPPAEVAALGRQPGVAIRGFVPDLDVLLQQAMVVVAPVRFGSGVKVKVLEAMGAGKAVVTTTVGVEGIEAEPGRDLIVADAPQSFATHVIALLNDPARRRALGEAAARWIAATSGPEVIAERVRQVMASVGRRA